MKKNELSVTVSGAAGRMGRAILEVFLRNKDINVVGALETVNSPLLGRDVGSMAAMNNIGVTISSSLESVIQATDVVVDFTTVHATLSHIQTVKQYDKAMVIGTTGFDNRQLSEIEEASQRIPIVLSPNMSPGVNTLFYLVGQAARLLGEEFDAEIVEIHHNRKKDAPSGTAIQFGRIIAKARQESFDENAVYTRQGHMGDRRKGEIGIMAMRAADVVGDHTVLFGGPGERIEFTHRSISRLNYAAGALMAARFVSKKKNGLFTMADVLGLPQL